MGKVIFITGGARSGKSSFAMKEASRIPGKRLYIATAEPLDDEMRERIRRHKKERPSDWKTIEEPFNIAGLIRKVAEEMALQKINGTPKNRKLRFLGDAGYDVIVLDCLTVWLSNLLLRAHNKDDIKQIFHLESRRLLGSVKVLKNSSPCGRSSLYIVSNEVGLGIVPENELGRIFRDMAGILNQRVAEIADEVYFVVSGIPVKIKG